MAEDELTTEEAAGDPEPEDAGPARELPSEAGLAKLVEPLDSATWEVGDGEWVVTVAASEYHGLAESARDEGFEAFVDLCAVDYFRRDPRFEVVLTVLNHEMPQRLRIKAGVAGTEPELSTVSDVYAGANFYEREAYDLFGITFVGHPDLTRILMPDDWQGYPLRKDYAVGAVPVQFKEAHKA